MRPQRIEGATRVVGESQGYIGLPLRDETFDCPVNGPGTPQMVTAWEVMPDELERLREGASVILSILGTTPPPLLMEVGEAPAERTPLSQDELHNVLAGRIAGSIIFPVYKRGGSYADVLALLESVIAGTILMLAKLGRDDVVLDTLFERVRERCAALRLGGIEPEGTS